MIEADEVMADNIIAETTLWFLSLSGKNNKLSLSFYTRFSKINNKTHTQNNFKMSQADIKRYLVI